MGVSESEFVGGTRNAKSVSRHAHAHASRPRKPPSAGRSRYRCRARWPNSATPESPGKLADIYKQNFQVLPLGKRRWQRVIAAWAACLDDANLTLGLLGCCRDDALEVLCPDVLRA